MSAETAHIAECDRGKVIPCGCSFQQWDTQSQRPYTAYCTLAEGHDGLCDPDGDLRIDGPGA